MPSSRTLLPLALAATLLTPGLAGAADVTRSIKGADLKLTVPDACTDVVVAGEGVPGRVQAGGADGRLCVGQEPRVARRVDVRAARAFPSRSPPHRGVAGGRGQGLQREYWRRGRDAMAIALQRGWLSGDQALELSRLDEIFQEEQWGVDEEAAERVARLSVEAAMLDGWFRALD